MSEEIPKLKSVAEARKYLESIGVPEYKDGYYTGRFIALMGTRSVTEFLSFSERDQIEIVGFQIMDWTPGSGHFEGWNPIRDIRAAWDVHKKMGGLDSQCVVKYCNWLARLVKCDDDMKYLPVSLCLDPLSFLVLIKPVHICVAALVAVGVLE